MGGLCVVGILINSSNVVELMVASDKLGITSVTMQCCAIIDRCPLDRVLQIISDASDIGLNDLAVLDSKVTHSTYHCVSSSPVGSDRRLNLRFPFSHGNPVGMGNGHGVIRKRAWECKLVHGNGNQKLCYCTPSIQCCFPLTTSQHLL